jgi:hypothetical protein
MKITILKAEKDTVTLTTGVGEELIKTVAVVYIAAIEVDGCLIRGSFRFDDEFILSENEACSKIANLFLENISLEGGETIEKP